MGSDTFRQMESELLQPIGFSALELSQTFTHRRKCHFSFALNMHLALERLGVYHTTIDPGLDGSASLCKWHWRVLKRAGFDH